MHFIGQDLRDLILYTRGRSPIELMRQFFERSYLFPTCPDTIDGMTFTTKDPLVVEQIPHVFFVGNQPNHEFGMCEFKNGARTLMFTIPKFSETFETVLLNQKTMETQILQFRTCIEK